MRSILVTVLFLATQLLLSEPGFTAAADPTEKTFTQPDGTIIRGFIRGDEHRSWFETTGGFTIAQEQGNGGRWFYVTGFDSAGNPLLSTATADLDVPFGTSRSIRPPITPFGNSLRPGETNGVTRIGPDGQFSGNLLFILAEFGNQAGTTSDSSWSGLLNQTADYFDEASYGRATFAPANETSGTPNDGVVDWVNIGPTHPNYENNFSVVTQQTTADAILAADAYVDFSVYDTNFDGKVTSDELSIAIILAGNEASSGGPAPSVWGHAWCLFLVTPPVVDGVQVSSCSAGDGYTVLGYTQFGEYQSGHLATFGIIAHELGHLTFGLPDLYDYDFSTDGIYGFGLMGSGSWGMTSSDTWVGETPVLPTAWTKHTLGWADAAPAAGTINFAAAGSTLADPSNTVYRAATSGADTEYFLIENRQQVGYDAGLWLFGGTHCGLAIWHVDDTRTTNQVDSDRWVDLEEADGTEGISPFAPDLFSSAINSSFNDITSPSARLKSGALSGVEINNISNCVPGFDMSADFPVTDSQAPVPTITVPANGTTQAPAERDIAGKVSDDVSGVSQIQVLVQTIGTSPALYWSGSAWVTTATFNNAVLSATGTVWTLPNVDLTTAGNYRVSVIARDNAGNASGITVNPRSNFTVAIADAIAPSAQVTNPFNESSVVPAFRTISGTTSDNTAGSGVSRIQVLVQTVGTSSTLYWNGSGWVTTAHFNDANLNVAGTVWALPGVDLTIARNYRVSLIARDYAGNASGITANPRSIFSVATADTVAPSAQVTNPADGSTVAPATRPISGTTSDNTGGSGVSRVQVLVQTVGTSPTFYWNGSAWTGTARFNDANLNVAGTVWALPGVDLTVARNYRVSLIARDNAGNASGITANPRSIFSVATADTVAPSAQVTNPADGSTVAPATRPISGTTSDNAGGSGVSRVQVLVQTVGTSPTLYWNGSAWTGTARFNDANLNVAGTVWALPGVDLTVARSYRVSLIARDNSGNASGITANPRSNFTVAVADNAAPTAQVTAPANGTNIAPAIRPIAGTTSDNTGGTGVSRIQVLVQTVGTSPTLYWNGSAWVGTAQFNDANLNIARTVWVLPNVDLTGVGSYRVSVIARDNAGNASGISVNPRSTFNVGP